MAERSRRLGRSTALCALAVAVGASSLALAQTTTSTIEGRVLDPSGAGIPGARVDVRGATTTRSVLTGERGFYRAFALSAGAYSIAVSRGGFNTTVLSGVVLLLDRNVTLDVSLQLPTREETVTVEVRPPAIDLTSSMLRHAIDARTIESIPLNGRNYLDLMLLTPGVAVNANARSDLANADTRGSILGERAGNTAFLIDGFENTDDFRGGVLQSYTQDAIQEFEVISAGYKAEFGRGSGGVVNVVTKSGANDFRGSAFFYMRNDALDASNDEDRETPSLKRYNSGLSAGGPFVKDRSWYFGSFERFKETRESIFPSDVPDLLRSGEDFSRHPETASYRVFGKYVQNLTARNTLRAQAGWVRAENLNEPSSATSLPSASNNNASKTFLGTLALTSLFGSRGFLESSFGFRDQRFDQNQDSVLGRGYSIFFLDDGTTFDFGPPGGSVQRLKQRYLTLREALSLFPDERHTVKLGAEYTRTIVDGVNGQALVNVIATTRSSFARYGRDSFQIPQGVGFLNPGDELTRLRNNGLSLFAQDDWRIVPKLTLNMGLRYDRDSRFNDADNLAPRLGAVWNPDGKTAVRLNWGFFYDRYRLGIAHSVPELGGVNGTSVVELDYPRLMADVALPFPGSLGALNRTVADPFLLHRRFGIPFDAVITRGNIQALTGLSPDQFLVQLNRFLAGLGRLSPVDFSPSTGYLRQDLSAAFVDVVRVNRPFETPHNRTFTAGVQRSFFGELVVGATYAHRRIRNILGLRLTNLARESREIGAPITSDGGPLQRTYGSWYDGKYKAVILTVEKQFRHGFQLLGSYTRAWATDNLLNSNLGLGPLASGGGAVPTDSLDLETDRGNSDLLVPHVVVVSGVVSLPGGLWLSGVFRATSGVYFSASGEPIDYDGDGIISMRPRETRRNQFRGPGSSNLDVRLEKRFSVGRRYGMSLLLEAFNVTNARNPRLIDSFYEEGRPGQKFGETRVPLPGREVQLGLRARF